MEQEEEKGRKKYKERVEKVEEKSDVRKERKKKKMSNTEKKRVGGVTRERKWKIGRRITRRKRSRRCSKKELE